MTSGQRLAALFLAHPGRWFSMYELAQIAGTGGWRTRISELTRAGMNIERSATYYTINAAGERITHSDRRYMPCHEREQAHSALTDSTDCQRIAETEGLAPSVERPERAGDTLRIARPVDSLQEPDLPSNVLSLSNQRSLGRAET